MRSSWWTIAANFLMLLLVAALLFSCQPYLTYDEMYERSDEPGMQKRIDRFEADALEADLWITLVPYCKSGCFVYCEFQGAHRASMDYDRTEFKDLNEKVKWFRYVRRSCGFKSRDTMW